MCFNTINTISRWVSSDGECSSKHYSCFSTCSAKCSSFSLADTTSLLIKHICNMMGQHLASLVSQPSSLPAFYQQLQVTWVKIFQASICSICRLICMREFKSL